MRDNLSFY